MGIHAIYPIRVITSQFIVKFGEFPWVFFQTGVPAICPIRVITSQFTVSFEKNFGCFPDGVCAIYPVRVIIS